MPGMQWNKCVNSIAGIKFVKKIGGPSQRGNKSLARDARPLGPWIRKRPSVPQGMPFIVHCVLGDAG